ncbi:MAG TPA: HK97 family phage prohead protease [Xanthobacteraceae bacterium]|nr:HK97 family phage prohead protease [Xanthobacteraceae bacterium]
MRLYGTIQKVDADKRMVYGYASTEAVDASGEVILRSAIEGALEDYLEFANIREMHQLSAVGTAEEASVDDKGLYLAAHIVDDAAWAKVKAGVYKGFSVGGKVIERDPLNKKTITKVALHEISIVDRPQNPEARFDVWKAAGADGGTTLAKRDFSAAERKKDAKSGAAMKDGSFPIENAKDLRNAIRLAGNAKNPDAARRHIKARAKALGLESEIPDTWKAAMSAKIGDDAKTTEGEIAKAAPVAADPAAEDAAADEAAVEAAGEPEPEPEPEADDPVTKATGAVDALVAALDAATPKDDLAKSMYHVSRFADMLSSLSYLHRDVADERDYEGDGSPIPEKLRDWLKAGITIHRDMTKEEGDELVAAANKIKKAVGADDLAKAAAEPAGGDSAPDASEALAKAQSDLDALAKALAARDEALNKITERIEPLVKTVESLGKRLTEIEEQPAPAKTAGAGVAISKEADSAGSASAVAKSAGPATDDIAKALEAMSPEDRAMALIKAAQQLPRPVTYR